MKPHLFTLARSRCGRLGGILSVALFLSFVSLRRLPGGRKLGRWLLAITASCGARTFLSLVFGRAQGPAAFQAAAVQPARELLYYTIRGRFPGQTRCWRG